MAGFDNKYPYTDFHELNLDWFLARFKEVTDQVTTLDATVRQFTQFVTDYFENLDVQEEINTKLDQMAADGSLSALIQPLFDEYKTEIDAEIDSQNNVVSYVNNQTTIQNGRISVLEGRMDTFASLPDGSTAGNAELLDIRVGENGITYDSAGDAVRGQVSDVHDLIDFTYGNSLIDFTDGAYIKTNVASVDVNTPVADANYKYAVLACSEGDEFTVSCQGAAVCATFCFIDNSGTKLWTASTSFVADNIKLVAPANAAYLILNDRIANTAKSYTGVPIKNVIVEKSGVYQVLSKNIDGMAATGATAITENIFSQATLLWDGYYVGIDANGYINRTSNADYKTYIMPVDSSLSYAFTFARFAAKTKSDKNTAVGALATNATSVNMSGADYIVFSFNIQQYPVATYSVNKIEKVYKIPANWDITGSASIKPEFDETEGSLASGAYMEIAGRSAVKDGEKIIFKGVLTSFSSITLEFRYAGGIANYITVDATNITVKNDTGSATVTAHGMTIENDITLLVEFIKGDAKITLISNGHMYTDTVQWIAIMAVATSPRIQSTGTACSYAKLMTIYNGIKRKLWMFGDSYVSFNNTQRWPYYLVADGFDENILISGSAGCSSAITRTSILTLLNYGTPEFAIFATGMNDGDDTDASTPAATWVTNRDYFLADCVAAGITPIFCTIPTCPVTYNEAKNSWIRNSGYRYIDFAAAVGAQSDGTWYSGMLAADNVHPTEYGAKALYSQLLIDLPEVMF